MCVCVCVCVCFTSGAVGGEKERERVREIHDISSVTLENSHSYNDFYLALNSQWEVLIFDTMSNLLGVSWEHTHGFFHTKQAIYQWKELHRKP